MRARRFLASSSKPSSTTSTMSTSGGMTDSGELGVAAVQPDVDRADQVPVAELVGVAAIDDIAPAVDGAVELVDGECRRARGFVEQRTVFRD